jgi:carbonic anhydrase/acetyltransferase-like protein (isoleucine patch superfamily)
MSIPHDSAGLAPAGSRAEIRARVLAAHRPQVHDTAFVAPGAVVIGRVELGPESSVWYGTVLRADGDLVSLGARSNLQDGTVVHSDPGRPVLIGSGVSVGHRAVVHGCTVEDDVLIGMGAVLLNGCVVGTGSIVAAGAVIREGMVVPPRSLVTGVPGQVRRETSEDDLVRIRQNAVNYVEVLPVYRTAPPR